ncbi:MAG: PhzF family phenazine biosynthesis protein, partial [Intestinibacter sp.]|uniref:PhzF family phenazine biosynthesis protein n=1 Tax=Intestinibacter sp. TaxID=1965304 RepID=UPI003F145A0B
MKQYVVDAFSEKVFGGNPAAICVMDAWLPEDTMMSITIENNLSETAFTVKEGDKYKLRWFTPGGEIDLCGHATLASAYVIMNYVEADLKTVTFST